MVNFTKLIVFSFPCYYGIHSVSKEFVHFFILSISVFSKHISLNFRTLYLACICSRSSLKSTTWHGEISVIRLRSLFWFQIYVHIDFQEKSLWKNTENNVRSIFWNWIYIGRQFWTQVHVTEHQIWVKDSCAFEEKKMKRYCLLGKLIHFIRYYHSCSHL